MANMKKAEPDEPGEEVQKPSQGKRKSHPDPEYSTPRPRKINFKQEVSEEEEEQDDDDHPHVPTPTSSPNTDESSGEDKDLFKGPFKLPHGPRETPPPTFQTPPSKKSDGKTPASTMPCSQKSWTGLSEDLQEMLAGIDDAVLGSLPSSLSRLASGVSSPAFLNNNSALGQE